MRILIVDDEAFFRTSFETYIDWASLGCEVVGSAANGEAALAAMRTLAPDLVFLDIQMPGMNGLQVLEVAQKEYPDVRIVVLSGYNEFHYARQALRCGAADYIHKGELGTELLTQTVRDQQQALRHTARDTALHVPERVSGAEFLQKCLHDLHFDTARAAPRSQMKIKERNLFVIMLRIRRFSVVQQRYQEKKSLLYQGIESLMQEILASGETELLFYDKQTACLICSFSRTYSQETMYKELLYLSQKSVSALRRFLNLEIDAGISAMHQRYADLAQAMHEAQAAAMLQFAFGEEKIGGYPQLDHYTVVEHIAVQPLLQALRQEGLPAFERAWEAVERMLFVHDARMLVTPSAARIAAESVAEYFVSEAQRPFWFARLRTAESLASILQTLRQILQNHYDISPRTRPLKRGSLVNAAVAWIDAHLSDTALSLESVAEAVAANPSYLSRVFKKETGLTVTDYINRQRIQAALPLLHAGTEMIYQIAYQVGYNNVEHFNRTFKKVTGHSPGYFRDKPDEDTQ